MSDTPVPAAPEPISSQNGSISSADFGDYSIQSNSETAEQLIESDKADRAEKERLSEAARELGAKGGKVSAEKRVIKPIPDKKASSDTEQAEESLPEVEDDDDELAEAEKLEAKGELGKPRSDVRSRMLEKAREAKELREKNARLEGELAEARRVKEQQRQETEAPLAETDGKPKVEEFETYEEYLDARDQYNRMALEYELSQKAAVQAQEQRYWGRVKSAEKNYSDKITAAFPSQEAFLAEASAEVLALKPSYLLSHGERPGPANAVADELVTMEDPVPVIKYLSKHPEDLEKVTDPKNGPREVARLMARIEERATAAAVSPEPVKVKTFVPSKAKPPVKPVQGAPHAEVDVYDPELPYDEYRRIANAREGRR